MSSDYLTLLADLTAWAERISSHYVVPPDVLVRARAALAQPEPEAVGPTDEELRKLWRLGWQSVDPEAGAILFAREALARYGHQPAPPAEGEQRHPAPVPVSERLPGPEDCAINPRTGQGQWCWGWVQHDPPPYSSRWRMMRREWLADEAVAWLPAHALPLPAGEVEHG